MAHSHDVLHTDMSTFWGVGQPNNETANIDDCVVMVLGRTNKSDNEFQWVDHSCLEPLIQQQFDVAPICQRGTVADTSLTTNAEATKAKFECLPGWAEFDGHCYLPKTDTKSWLNAENDCKAYRGGHLASIHSEAESNFVAQFLIGDFWTGGKWLYPSFTWSDGSAWDYAEFVPNMLNYGFGSELCVRSQYDSNWDKAQCYEEYFYICKV